MDVRNKIRESLRSVYGEFETYLEHEYEEKLTDNLVEGDYNKKRQWLAYNQIILELKHSLKDMLSVKELQYKLTDVSEPNDDCIRVVENLKNKSKELERLYLKVNSFKKIK